MNRPFIVIGDKTDHGGVVVGASSTTDTHGKQIARVGDQVTCPQKGHGTTVIVSGDPTMIIDGKAAARHGDKCACGATLIAAQFVSTVSDGGAAQPQAARDKQAANAIMSGIAPPPVRFDEQAQLTVVGAEYAGLPWFITTSDGQTFSGRLDGDGRLPRIISEFAQDYEVCWGEEALDRIDSAS